MLTVFLCKLCALRAQSRVTQSRCVHAAQYADQEYWDKRYGEATGFFEWYHGYDALREVLDAHLSRAIPILQVGASFCFSKVSSSVLEHRFCSKADSCCGSWLGGSAIRASRYSESALVARLDKSTCMRYKLANMVAPRRLVWGRLRCSWRWCWTATTASPTWTTHPW